MKTVVERLQDAGIAYMLTGSMALAVYATPRMTRDIDLVVQLKISDADTIVHLFEGDFYIDAACVREAVLRSGIFNIIHNESVIKIDLIVRKDDVYRIEEFSRRRQLDLEGFSLSIVAPEDLVLSKLVWARTSYSELQLRDVRLMLTSGTPLDREYLEHWATILGVDALLREILNDV